MKEKAIVAVSVLVLFVVAGTVGTATASSPSYGINVQQAEGEVDITIVTPGAVDSMQLVAPSGTRSLVMPEGSIHSGSRMTLRSNESVYEFFEENNVTIPTRTREEGYMRITSPEDVPLQNLIFQNDDLTQDTSYDRRSAYLACLYDHHESGVYEYPEFEVGGTSFPSNISIPCHGPVLAQFDEIQAGTSEKIGNDTITTPLILEEGEYALLGVIDNCRMIQTISVSATVASGESLGDEPGTCAQSEIDGEGLSGDEDGGIPVSAYLIALLVVAVVMVAVVAAAVAHKRFRE